MFDRKPTSVVLPTVVLTAALLVAVGASCLYNAVRSADHDERALHACICTTDVLERYLIETGGRWPASWDDMQSTVGSIEQRTLYDWPSDRAELEKFVSIDFTADSEWLVRLSADDFKPISPVGRCHSSYNRGFPALLDALRRFHTPADCGGQ